MKTRSGRSLSSQALRVLAIPIVMSGCVILTEPCHDERYVAVAGSVIDGGAQIASVTANLHADRGLQGLSFTWQFAAPSLEGHITSAVLVSSTRPVPILLNLPIREPLEPWGYQYAYFGTMEQRFGDTTPLLGGIFEVLAAGEGVLRLTTDLPAQPLVTIPLAVTQKADWHESACRS